MDWDECESETERINTFVTGAKVGYIKGSKYKIDECNIVIAKVQSLMKSKYKTENELKLN